MSRVNHISIVATLATEQGYVQRGLAVALDPGSE